MSCITDVSVEQIRWVFGNFGYFSIKNMLWVPTTYVFMEK